MTAYCQSEIGLLKVTATRRAITSVTFEADGPPPQPVSFDLPPVLADCLAQLSEYFRGERTEFSLPLEPAGTPFQQSVWHQVAAVPYGQTASYLDIARAVGNEQAVRAVGHANGQNKIVIIIPCHRVIGSNGRLTGYGGGLWRKAWLLQHEARLSSRQMSLF